ncbi:MAG: pyridoxamine 5'-phosphate oxidase [Acidimicrobiia bacterium]|nr:pyridoxamine 5'-phosphate oxidase [Acidimicrobiia bacterium]
MIKRDDYSGPPLDPATMAEDPTAEFMQWLQAAEDAGLPQPNAMSLATAVRDRPSVRTVLLKGVDPDGLVFYTNYESRKGRELADNQHAAVAFTWLELHRSVRIEGTVTKVSDQESDDYYAGRPRGAQLAAGISRQSEVISDRSQLEHAFAAADEKFEAGEVPRPEHWGGYRLKPEVFEFWQGRPDRLHDRIRYRWDYSTWAKERLSP